MTAPSTVSRQRDSEPNCRIHIIIQLLAYTVVVLGRLSASHSAFPTKLQREFRCPVRAPREPVQLAWATCDCLAALSNGSDSRGKSIQQRHFHRRAAVTRLHLLLIWVVRSGLEGRLILLFCSFCTFARCGLDVSRYLFSRIGIGQQHGVPSKLRFYGYHLWCSI
jgi:hypothetical protein